MSSAGRMKVLGETRDDAAGEAFDKAAKMLGLGYPGGPAISRRAEAYARSQGSGLKDRLCFPRPMISSADFDFSFSGLKTALLYQLKKDLDWKKRRDEYCYSFQKAIIDILLAKTLSAAKKFRARTVMLSGGVSANQALRHSLSEKVSLEMPGANFLVPDHQYTTDNAVMIAAAAAFKPGKSLDFRRLKADSGLQFK